MLSIEELRKIEPKLASQTDDEVVVIREYLYGMAGLLLETYLEEKQKKS